jgi:hypothetical protein
MVPSFCRHTDAPGAREVERISSNLVAHIEPFGSRNSRAKFVKSRQRSAKRATSLRPWPGLRWWHSRHEVTEQLGRLRPKDPGSAQLKWVPVIVLEREGIFDYCGLVNSRNSYGYVGFQKFYAQISKNEKGQFTKGLVRTIGSDDVGTIATDELCEKHGYVDLSQAR